MLRQLAFDEIVERGFVQNLAQACADGDPDLLQVSCGADVLDQLGTVAADVRHRAVHGADDVGQAYLGRRSREPEATVGPALALHNAGMLQGQQNALEELERNLLAISDDVSLDQNVAGRGKFGHRADRIVGPSRDAHIVIVTPGLVAGDSPAVRR